MTREGRLDLEIKELRKDFENFKKYVEEEIVRIQSANSLASKIDFTNEEELKKLEESSEETKKTSKAKSKSKSLKKEDIINEDFNFEENN